MNFDRIKEKLEILADAAKYDVSCSSSGGNRKNKGGLGNSHVSGICHSYTEDGRCISLLKILLNQSLHLRLRLLRFQKIQRHKTCRFYGR
jgi:predicted DNA-binding helix-hairpin-helix protein